MSDPTVQDSPLTAPLRVLFAIAFVLVVIAGLQLFVLASATSYYFAWTISPPLGAALLGASYWSSIPLVLSAVFAPSWRFARIGYAAVLVFTTLTMIVTLLHLDRFYFWAPGGVAVVATWAWLVVYVGVPPLLALALWWQAYSAGMSAARGVPLPGWLRAGYLVVGLIVLVVGIEFLLLPGTTGAWWPWRLSPLVAGAAGSWFVAYAVAAATLVAANDRVGSFWPAVSFSLIGALQLLAVALHVADFNVAQPGAIPYLAFWLAVIVIGLATVALSRSARA